MKTKGDLLSGSILDKILIFAIPLALTSILQQLFNAADVAVVGRFASKQAMAAVGSNAPVVSLFVNFFVGLSVGANVVISRNIGAKLEKRARSAVHTSMMLAVLSGIFIAIVGNIVARPIVSLLGTPAEIADYSVKYLRIYFGGMPFIMLYNFEAAIFRSNGNTEKPLLCLTIGGLFNVAANLFFVLVLHMDVDGVAIATVMANAISSMLLLFFLMRENSIIKVEPSKLCLNRADLKLILQIGVPSGVQSMAFSVSNLCVQSAVNSLGADAMAAAAAAFNIEIFVYYIINAFTQTGVTFIGQNYGAGNHLRCRKVVKRVVLTTCVATVISGGLILIFNRPLLGLFTTESDVIALGAIRLKVLMFGELINAIMDNLTGVMRGLGKSLIPAIVVVLGVCGTRITWVFTGFKIYHSWTQLMMLFPVSWAISAAVLVFMYFKVSKKMLVNN